VGPPQPPDPKSIKDSLSKSGARRPDEDGMLEMVRLIDDDDDEEGDAPKSATAFFKIPKSARTKPAASAGGGAPRIGAPPVAGALPGRPPGGPPPIMGPGGPPPIAGGMISGPVAGGGPLAISGPTAGGPGGAPFGNVQAPEPEPQIGQNRTRSFVTIALVVAMLLFFLGTLAVAGAGIVYFIMTMEPEKETAAEPAKPDREDRTETRADTAIVATDLKVAPAPTARTPQRPAAGASTPKPAAPKPAASSGGTLRVRLVSGDVTSCQVVCKDYTRRARFVDGVATFQEVPEGTPCALNLSSLGGPVAKFRDAKAGQTYNCTITSPEVASCN
jgi:hypothetical protein